jgi:hypothetical protein
MKHLKATLFLLLGLFMFSTVQPAMAITSPSNVSAVSIEQQRTDLKKEFKLQKRMSRFETLMNKMGVDFKDPVKKWLWFAVLGWAAGLVLYIIAVATAVGTVSTGTGAGLGISAILGILGWACFLFGGISFVIWLVKKFAD